MMLNTDCTIFQCPICLEDFDDPKALPCLHSFCRLCISEYIRSCRQVTDSVILFPCPVCRKEVKIATDGDPVDSLQDNYVIKTLKESSEVESHGKIRCDIHNSKHIEFICKCHKEFICSTCLLNNHRHCSVTEIKEAISSQRLEIDESKARIAKLRDEIHTKMDELAAKKTNVLSDTSMARQGVRLFVKEIKSLIAKAELKLLNEIDNFEKNHIKKYDCSISKAEKILAQIDSNSCESDTFKTSKYKDVAHINSILIKLNNLAFDTSSTVSNLVQMPEELTIRFKPNMELFKVLKTTLGAINTAFLEIPRVQVDAKRFEGNDTSSNLEIQQSTLESNKQQFNCSSKSTDGTSTLKIMQGNVFSSSSSETIKMDFKTSTDKMKCYITGLAIMKEGSCLVADHGNAKLKIFDAECKISQQKVFSSEPWSVCLVNNNKFLVSFPSENLIQSFTYKHNRLAVRATKIETSGRCYGLAINEDKTLAVCVRRPSGSYIAVYANLNELVSEIETSSKPSLSGNWYLTFISDGKCIAYTDECQNSVKCVNFLSGQEMWKKTVSAPKGIVCVCGDIFIVTHGSNTLKRFAEHDGAIKEDIKVGEIPTVSCLALDNDQSHLLVSENEGSKAVMFFLK